MRNSDDGRPRQIEREGRWTIKRGRKRLPPDGTQQRAAAAGEIAVPVFGYKNRFVVTHAARHDGGQLGAVLDQENTASDVWADTAYRSRANLALLRRLGLKAQFQRAKPRLRSMPPHVARGNAATRTRVRSRVEHVFAAEKCRMGLIVRTVSLLRATAEITLANLA